MKTPLITSLILLINLNGLAQKVALLDTRAYFKHPIVYTDSVTESQVSSGLFPLSVKDIDSFYVNLSYIKNMVSKPARSEMQSFELKTSTTNIVIKRIPMAYADRYIVNILSTNNGVLSSFAIVKPEERNKEGYIRIKNFLKYIKSNFPMSSAIATIHPKIYKAVIVSDK